MSLKKENERSISQSIIRTILHSRKLSNVHENVNKSMNEKEEKKKKKKKILLIDCTAGVRDCSLAIQHRKKKIVILFLSSHLNNVVIQYEKSIDQSRKEEIKNDQCVL